MIAVPTLSEPRRGCGYRKPGGLYLVSDGPGEACAKLPVVLCVCPTCGQGIKPSRGWTWIEPDAITKPEPHGGAVHSALCPLATGVERCGLLWVGAAYYTPASFLEEARGLGISRRIAALPRDYEPGTWVFLAHREAEWKPCPQCGDSVLDPGCEECGGAGRVPVPAIFSVFRPDRVEYVVRGDEGGEELQRLMRRGIRPVRVEPLEEQGELGDG